MQLPHPSLLSSDEERATLERESGNPVAISGPSSTQTISQLSEPATVFLSGGVNVASSAGSGSVYLNNTMELSDAVAALSSLSGMQRVAIDRVGSTRTGFTFTLTFTPEDYAVGAVPVLSITSNDLVGVVQRKQARCCAVTVLQRSPINTIVSFWCARGDLGLDLAGIWSAHHHKGLDVHAGTNVATSDRVLQQASPERELKPIPGDFLRLPVTQPHGVTVTVNGIVSACFDNATSCAFAYSEAATPAVTSMEPARGSTVQAGATVTLRGTGLAAVGGATEVMIGDVACMNVQESGSGDSAVRCTLDVHSRAWHSLLHVRLKYRDQSLVRHDQFLAACRAQSAAQRRSRSC